MIAPIDHEPEEPPMTLARVIARLRDQHAQVANHQARVWLAPNRAEELVSLADALTLCKFAGAR